MDKKLYVLGTESFKRELLANGLQVVDRYESVTDCLVVGFDTELTYSKLVDACKLLFEGIDFIATNPDLACPTSFGFIPDCGSICAILEATTGKKPTYIGKPSPMMVEYAIEKAGYSKVETIVVGDRLYTDIACGVNAGVSTGVVLSGETKIDDIKKSVYKPDYVFQNIGELYYQLLNDIS